MSPLHPLRRRPTDGGPEGAVPGGDPGPQQEPAELPQAGARGPDRPRAEPAVRGRVHGIPADGRGPDRGDWVRGPGMRDLEVLRVDDDAGREGEYGGRG